MLDTGDVDDSKDCDSSNCAEKLQYLTTPVPKLNAVALQTHLFMRTQK